MTHTPGPWTAHDAMLAALRLALAVCEQAVIRAQEFWDDHGTVEALSRLEFERYTLRTVEAAIAKAEGTK